MQLSVPVIGILRGIQGDFFGPLMDAAFDNGLQAIEITKNTPFAEEIVSRQRSRVPDGKWLGMGTICNLEEAKGAVDAGAMFMVTPNTDPAVIDYAGRHQIPIIAGGFTPTEIYNAWSAGASMIKVFPCRLGGPNYIKDLRGPFDHIPLVAVGGVTRSNLTAYFEAGAAAVGVGASLFGKQAIARQDIDDIGRNVHVFIEAAKRARFIGKQTTGEGDVPTPNKGS